MFCLWFIVLWSRWCHSNMFLWGAFTVFVFQDGGRDSEDTPDGEEVHEGLQRWQGLPCSEISVVLCVVTHSCTQHSWHSFCSLPGSIHFFTTLDSSCRCATFKCDPEYSDKSSTCCVLNQPQKLAHANWLAFLRLKIERKLNFSFTFLECIYSLQWYLW